MADDQPTRAVRFWDCGEDNELLSHTEISEAVEAWADSIHPAPLPETVTVYGFAPMELPSASSLATDVLDHILESLDEELADPDGNGTKPTEAMRDAALVFAEAIRAEYEPWFCERVTKVVVRVADHVPAAWMQPASSSPANKEG
jgi:hypothetical protein